MAAPPETRLGPVLGAKPLVAKPSARDFAEWGVQPAETMNHRSILLVDDDPLLQDGFVRLLRGRFVVRTATSAAKALELLRAHAREFFAIVTDVHMPDMDGPEFLTMASRIAPHVRTVLMSGGLETTDLVRAINGPRIFRCLLKPVPPARLLTALEDAWRAHASSSEDAGVSVG